MPVAIVPGDRVRLAEPGVHTTALERGAFTAVRLYQSRREQLLRRAAYRLFDEVDVPDGVQRGRTFTSAHQNRHLITTTVIVISRMQRLVYVTEQVHDYVQREQALLTRRAMITESSQIAGIGTRSALTVGTVAVRADRRLAQRPVIVVPARRAAQGRAQVHPLTVQPGRGLLEALVTGYLPQRRSRPRIEQLVGDAGDDPVALRAPRPGGDRQQYGRDEQRETGNDGPVGEGDMEAPEGRSDGRF